MARQPVGKVERDPSAMVEHLTRCNSVVCGCVRDSARRVDGERKPGTFSRLHDVTRRARHYKRYCGAKEFWYRISVVGFSGATALAGFGATAQAIVKALRL